MKIYELMLPFPPSVNGYWRAIVRGNHATQILSAKGRAYRGSVNLAAMASGVASLRLSGRLAVTVLLNPPDRRKRDIDNFGGKAILDGLTHAGVWLDDEQIDDLHITRGEIVKGGHATVTIREIS